MKKTGASKPIAKKTAPTKKPENDALEPAPESTPVASERKLCGIVSKGLGEGTRFLSMPEYRKQFNLLLGFKPFPGTLNVTIEKPEELTEFVVGLAEERVSGFKHEGRAYGGISMYEVDVKKKGARTKTAPGALVVPDKSHRTGVAELVAETSLRETLRLEDGDDVVITPRVKGADSPAEREPLQEVVEQMPDDNPETTPAQE